MGTTAVVRRPQTDGAKVTIRGSERVGEVRGFVGGRVGGNGRVAPQGVRG